VGTARMRILNVAYPLLPVSAGSAGGAEQILYLLDHGLRKRGIESVVIAAKGSKVSGTLWPTPAASKDVTDRERSEAQEIHRRTIAKVLESERVDLIHFHGLDFSTYLPETHIPKLATLHLPITWYEPGSLNKPDVSLVSVSESQARAGAIDGLCQVVQNGIDVSKHSPGDAARSSLLWLGRICLEKGTDIALKVAHELDVPLTVAGPVHPFAFHQEYFRTKVQPLLDPKRIYVGPVDLDDKTRLLGSARALLVPSLAPETSSLVAMEAASSGTPVIAFRSGALPEVVQHGHTGFIADDLEGMIEAVERLDEISPLECRKYALQNFSSERMIDGYIKLYSDLLGA
jgi:glycosyltransferase involved in cell wall biosynthesis